MQVQHTVLIIDDNGLIREVYRGLLEPEGFSVVEASNGAEALMWCMKETADIILLDLEMPILDGWGFLEYRLREATIREIPVLVVTSRRETAGLRQALRRLGADELLQKPVLRDDMISAVRELLARPPIAVVPPPEEVPEDGRRRDPRVVFSIPIRVRMRSSRDTSGRLRELSPGGLGAYLPRRLVEGETVTISFDIEGCSLSLMGSVLWSEESATTADYHHGIRFTDRQEASLPLHAYSFFREHSEALLLSKRQPLLGEEHAERGTRADMDLRDPSFLGEPDPEEPLEADDYYEAVGMGLLGPGPHEDIGEESTPIEPAGK